MSNQNGGSKLQRFINARSQSSHLTIAEILNDMKPDDPIRPLVEGLRAVKQDLAEDIAEVRSKIELFDTDPKTSNAGQGLTEEQSRKLNKQLGAAIETAAEAVAKHNQRKQRDYALIWLGVSTLLVGVAIGYWISEARSAEARRNWDWNQGLVQECRKQGRKTCNTHVVPPEQW